MSVNITHLKYIELNFYSNWRLWCNIGHLFWSLMFLNTWSNMQQVLSEILPSLYLWCQLGPWHTIAHTYVHYKNMEIFLQNSVVLKIKKSNWITSGFKWFIIQIQWICQTRILIIWIGWSPKPTGLLILLT